MQIFGLNSLVPILAFAAAIGCGDSGSKHGQGRGRPTNGTDKASAPDSSGAQLIKVTQPRRRDLVLRYNTDGWLESIRTADIASPITGVIHSLRVHEGSKVRKGEPLGVIDETTIELQAKHDQLLVRQSTNELERVNYLKAQGAASEQEVLTQQLLADTQQLSAELSALKSEQLILRAPFTGVVSKRYREPGEQAGPGTPVVQLVDTSALKVQLSVPEEDAPRVPKGTPVTITRYSAIAAGDAHRQSTVAHGQVTRRSAKIDPRDGTLKIAVVLENPPESFSSGSYVEAIIQLDVRKDVLSLPRSTIFTIEDESYVYRVEDNQAKRHKITVGIEDGKLIEVTAGLSPEAMVILDAEEIDDGMELRPVTDEPVNKAIDD